MNISVFCDRSSIISAQGLFIGGSSHRLGVFNAMFLQCLHTWLILIHTRVPFPVNSASSSAIFTNENSLQINFSDRSAMGEGPCAGVANSMTRGMPLLASYSEDSLVDGPCMGTQIKCRKCCQVARECLKGGKYANKYVECKLNGSLMVVENESYVHWLRFPTDQ